MEEVQVKVAVTCEINSIDELNCSFEAQGYIRFEYAFCQEPTVILPGYRVDSELGYFIFWRVLSV